MNRFVVAILCVLQCFFFVSASLGDVVVVDDRGKEIRLDRPASRVIPLYAAASGILKSIGATQVCIARTDNDDVLPQSLLTIGTHMRPNLELVTALAPDLVIQFEGREEAGVVVEAIQGMGIPVAFFRVTSFAELFSCMDRVGRLVGREEATAAVITSLKQRLSAVQERAREFAFQPRVFFEVRYPQLLGAGQESMVNDIITMAGGINCLAEHPQRLVRVSEEMVLAYDPDVYLIQDGVMNKTPVPLPSRVYTVPLTAVRTGHWLIVAESLFSRPGPQSVTAVEVLADFLQEVVVKRASATP